MKKLISALLFLIIVGSNTANAQKVSVSHVGNFHVEKLDKKEVVLGFSALVENNTNLNIGARIKSGKIYKDGELLGTFKSLEKAKIKAKSNEDVNAKVRIEFGKDFNLLNEGLKALTGNKVELKVTGYVCATWFIFWRRIPFEHEEKISLGKFMK